MIILSLIVLTMSGCGGGNRLISNRGGDVVSGKLVLSDLPTVPGPDDYYIGYGDVLDVIFLFEREFSQSDIKVRPDGKISFPHIGEITVAGMTTSGLDSVITAAFSDILIEPDVTVVVKDFQSKMVYVMGEVGAQGGYPIEESSTLLQALARGKGPNEDAKRNGVMVIRRLAPDHIVGIQIDLTELIDKHRFDLDIPLEPYDIVYVPKSRISKAEDFILSLNTLLGEPMDMYLKGWQVGNIELMYEYWRRVGTGQQ